MGVLVLQVRGLLPLPTHAPVASPPPQRNLCGTPLFQQSRQRGTQRTPDFITHTRLTTWTVLGSPPTPWTNPCLNILNGNPPGELSAPDKRAIVFQLAQDFARERLLSLTEENRIKTFLMEALPSLSVRDYSASLAFLAQGLVSRETLVYQRCQSLLRILLRRENPQNTHFRACIARYISSPSLREQVRAF